MDRELRARIGSLLVDLMEEEKKNRLVRQAATSPPDRRRPADHVCRRGTDLERWPMTPHTERRRA